MLGSQAVELGPINIPVWFIAGLGGYVLSLVAPRFLSREHRPLLSRANDLMISGVLTGLVVWKLTPLLTRTAEIIDSPTRLIYYPGGLAGLVAGGVAGVMAIAISEYVHRRRAEESGASLRSLLIATVATGLLVVLPIAVVSLIPGRRSDMQAVSSDAVAQVSQSAAGRPTALIFWATWCGPCTAEMPEVQRLHEELGESVQILAVNLTTTESSPERVREYIESNRYTLPVLLDTRAELQTMFEVRLTPTTVILDPDGVEQFRRTGAVTSAWIERRVLPLRN